MRIYGVPGSTDGNAFDVPFSVQGTLGDFYQATYTITDAAAGDIVNATVDGTEVSTPALPAGVTNAQAAALLANAINNNATLSPLVVAFPLSNVVYVISLTAGSGGGYTSTGSVTGSGGTIVTVSAANLATQTNPVVVVKVPYGLTAASLVSGITYQSDPGANAPVVCFGLFVSGQSTPATGFVAPVSMIAFKSYGKPTAPTAFVAAVSELRTNDSASPSYV